ncbi:MAG: EAL domain-containing protein [Lachnospiraceae bacterium]|nr:EAL domain-containing protein [Lachnospiraceae bacterium]
MWNFSNTIPAICILTIFLLYYMSRPRLPVRAKATFIFLVVVEELTLMIDIIATFSIKYSEMFSVTFISLTNMIFFILFLVRIYLFFLFVVYVIDIKREKTKFKLRLGMIVFAGAMFITIASFFTGWVYSISDEGKYSSGPLYNIIYFHSFFYIISGLILLAINRRKVNKSQYRSCVIYLVILFVGLVVRILMPKHLVMDMFCASAIVVIYLAFENPEFYLNASTGLFNGGSFRLLINEYNNIYQKYKIICFSIKDYQVDRDMYGWQQMDRGLQLISEYLTENFRKDTVFYLRNGNFAVITKDVGREEEICTLIRQRFESTWLAEDTELFLYISFVIYDSELRANTEDAVSSIRAALIKAGRADNQDDIRIDEEMIRNVDHQIAVRKALEKAIEEDRILVYLQPVVNAKNYEIIGAEALARIIDPDIGFIPPNDFIPIAEMNGSISKLGKQVFEKTCKFIKEYNDEIGLEWINVNLSPIQCMNKNLADEFVEIVEKYEIPVSKIHLEITEQSVIDSEVMKSQMQILVQHGFKFSLDDYGSGYSNATSVVNYPLSNIKIDRGIIVSYFNAPSSLLPNEIKIFLDMDFSVTAEGVETKEMAEKLKEFGCDFLQGFYFSKPIPMDEFVEKYKKSNRSKK